MFSAKNELFTSPSGYQISRSVRLRSSATAYFNRTPASATNRTTWTWSGWIKRGSLTSDQVLFQGYSDANNFTVVLWDSSDKIQLQNRVASTAIFNWVTRSVYRDPAAWYHVVAVYDSTQATSTNRIDIYVNGVEITDYTTQTTGSQNATGFINNTNGHNIGRSGAGSQYFDGYMTEVNFVDGQALTPSSFGEYDAITGVWKPKKYTGTYGTNGAYLNFSDNSASTAATIGKDYSGNGNNWTPNNISVTAGATYDSMLDSPTSFPDGSTGRGNYAVMNPLDKHASLPAPTSGNLNLSNAASAWFTIRSTIAVTSGKWYAEVTQTGSNSFAGVMSGSSALTQSSSTNASGIYGFFNDGAGVTGFPYANGTSGTSFTIASSDVIGLAYDYDAQTIAIYRNNSLQATVTGVPKTAPMFFCASFAQTTATQLWNFGQRPFTYTPPSGFLALNTQNLPDATIKNGASYMAATTYTGTGAALTIANSANNTIGTTFQPDWVWIKDRSAVASSNLLDSVRGVRIHLESNTTNAETTEAVGVGLTAFNSNGFSLGTDNAGAGRVNFNGDTFVAWQWNAGGSTVTNTSGSISAQVRANPTAGFSVVTYTGTGAAATIGHGLGVAPSMIIIKNRQTTTSWAVYHVSVGANQQLLLNSTNAISADTQGFTATPSSTVFSVGTGAAMDTNQTTGGGQHVAYCFSAVAGYSAFGSYTGNGSTDGPFIFTGFRPRWIMFKKTSGGTDNWEIIDTSRNTSNVNDNGLAPNSSAAEISSRGGDVLSNGFKLRFANGTTNESGFTYIYMAFAENPFKYSLAR
jgi:hypothetical protein